MLEIFGDVGQSKVHRFQVQVQLKISVHSALVSETRMWADAQRDGRPVEYICGALCESSAFLVQRHKLWLTPTARVPCSNTANIAECKTWKQSEFCSWQNSVRGKSPQKCIYSIPAQEMAKHRAKFG